MNNQKETVKKENLQQLAGMLSVFQKLPETQRIAIQYYIKGRIDATEGTIEIPVEFAKMEGANPSSAVGA